MKTGALLATLLSLGLSAPAHAEPTASDPLLAAVASAPVLRAARERADAARERADASGRFPDPQLEGMYSQIRRPMGGEQNPMWEVTLSQPLPRAGERAADRDRASAAHRMAAADYAVMAGDMAAETAAMVSEIDAAGARAEHVSRQLARAEKLLAALDARIASGASSLSERLALQSNIASLTLMLERETAMADDARAAVLGLLGLPPDAPLPPFSAPAPAAIDPDTSPLVLLADSRADEARAMGRMARASTRPMTSIGLRFEREEQSMGNMDTIGVAFMTDLPFRSRGYALADQRAARADAAAARSEADSARHRARSALARAARAERLAETTRRLDTETSARLDAEYDALVRSAGTASGMGGATAVLMALELLERQTETRLRIIDAEAAVRAARAELWRHAPTALFVKP